MPRYKHPPYVHIYRDRHGKERIYYSRPGAKKIPLPGPVYSDAFIRAYNLAADGHMQSVTPTADARIIAGSIGDLLTHYYSAPEFLNLAPATQVNYRRILERFAERRRNWPVVGLKRSHIKKIIGEMEARPQAANSLLKRLKTLLNFAADIDMIPQNPLLGMRGLKVMSEGFHTWTDEEIIQFESVHPIGTKARLAMSLMLYTAQRKSDAIKLGWKNVKGDRIAVRQEKTDALVDIPIHPELWRVIEGTPHERGTFLITEHGRPFTANGFGNWMRDRCDEADLPQCSSHGLRKAMTKRLAEAGCSINEIMSITGHKTEGEVIRYAKDAQQKVLADHAMRALRIRSKKKHLLTNFSG